MRNIKRSILFILLISLFIPTSLFSMEEDSFLPPWLDEYDVRINQNGQYIDSKVKAIEDEDKVLAPLRRILEYNDYSVQWQEDRTILIDKDNFQTIKLNMDSNPYISKNEK